MKNAIKLITLLILSYILIGCTVSKPMPTYILYDQLKSAKVTINGKTFKDTYQYYDDGKIKLIISYEGYKNKNNKKAKLNKHIRTFDTYGRILSYIISKVEISSTGEEKVKIIRKDEFTYNGPPKGTNYLDDQLNSQLRKGHNPYYWRKNLKSKDDIKKRIK